MLRVRMFCDWDNDSRQLINRLRDQTDHFEGDSYGDILFVDDDSYDYSIVFDYLDSVQFGYPDLAKPTISLILEPPEIQTIRQNPPSIPTYSFCDDGHIPVYGLGFATVPKHHSPKLGERSRQLCMIASNKTLTPYHHLRHKIKDKLMGSDIDMDFYGRHMPHTNNRILGEIPPMNKQSVLDNYRFVIDFENSARNVVTDKFFDAILCRTVPVTNSIWLRDNYPKSIEFIDFDWPVQMIVEIVRYVSLNEKAAEYDLMTPRNDILNGKLCLAKWIEERVKEL